jgi:hypothetical protein
LEILSLIRNFDAIASKIGCTSEIKINKFYFVFPSVCTIFDAIASKLLSLG